MKEIKLFELCRSAVLLCTLGVCAWPLAGQNLAKAEELYRRTDFAGSLALLDKDSNDPATQFLIGQDYFLLGDWKRASDALQKATTGEPNRSDYMDWLGRVYGRRAEAGNPMSAPLLANKARQAFERAVQLDPKNREALSDLFDFYVGAPGFLGGGDDKAAAVADKMATVDPPQGFLAKARLAEKKKDYATAEARIRQAIALAPNLVGPRIALARLLAAQGRTRESDEAFLEAQKLNPNAARVWFARANVLIQQNRDLDLAKDLLQKYVRAPITVDDPPKEEAMRLLKQVGGA